ncbi:MAG: pyridoxal-phosphate-dependent aminotransferase family protein [Actinomycetota bacterium]
MPAVRKPEILMTPGPTPVPAEVLLAQASPIVYHRGPGFGDALRDCIQGLQWLLGTRNDVLTFTCSGTGAMESTVVNCFSPGDRVLIVSVGNFGQRFGTIASAYGLDVKMLDYEWGRTAKAADVAAALEPDIKGVFVQHSETSTGVVNDIEPIAAVVREHPALMIVDTVSGLGASPLRVDEWGIDVAAGGVQKAIMMSPGIGFVSVSDAAWKAYERSTCPRFYFDWGPVKRSHDLPDPESPYTPAVSLFLGLRDSLRMLRREGLENVFARHRLLSRAVKASVQAMGLELIGEDQDRAVCVTAIRCPEGIDGDAITALVRERFGIVFAPGQDKWKGKVFRIGHLGYLSPADVLQAMAALEMCLNELGHPVKDGAGVAAAQEVFAQETRA